MYKFFSDNNLLYPLQFGFRQKYSTVHVLISLTENIGKNLDENIGCGIFVELQKAFDTNEHDTLLSKLEHYDIYMVLLMNRLNLISQTENNVSINGYDSTLADVKFDVPQRSVLGPLLFLVHINDLNQALKFCKVHHFADDTNLIHFSKSVYRLNMLTLI